MSWIQNISLKAAGHIRRGMTTDEKELFLMILALFIIGTLFRLYLAFS